MLASRTIPVLAVALLGVTACLGRSATYGAEEASGPTYVQVDNESSLQVTVYVLRSSGERRRLGSAPANRRTTLTIPESIMIGLTSLRFHVDPIGSPNEGITTQVTVTPGDTVLLTIPPGMGR